MYALKNKVQLIGIVTSEPTYKTNTYTGKETCSFQLQTIEEYRNEKGQQVKETDYHNLEIEKNIDIYKKHIQKGNEIAVEGKLKYSISNNRIKTTFIQVREFLLLDKKVVA